MTYQVKYAALKLISDRIPAGAYGPEYDLLWRVYDRLSQVEVEEGRP